MTYSSVLVPILVAIVFPAYILVTRYIAIEARGRLAEKVDVYLGENGHPKELKDFVYHSFDNCIRLRFTFAVIYNLISSIVKRIFSITSYSNLSYREGLNQKYGHEQVNAALSIITELFFVNIVFAPILYILLICILITEAVMCVWLKNSYRQIKETITNQLERSVISAAH